jgi:hypothetical protein
MTTPQRITEAVAQLSPETLGECAAVRERLRREKLARSAWRAHPESDYQLTNPQEMRDLLFRVECNARPDDRPHEQNSFNGDGMSDWERNQ